MSAGRVVLSIGLAACAALPVLACAQDESTLPGAAAILRSGGYDRAIDAARRLLATDGSNAGALRILSQALLATGQYAAAESAATAFNAANPRSRAGFVPLGDALRLRGRRAAAESSYIKAASAPSPDSLSAAVRIAQLRFDRGEIDDAMRRFDRFIDIYNDRKAALSAQDLEAVAIACRYLGRDNPQLFKDALKAFDEAIARDSADLDIRVQLADLFLEKYNGADARQTLDQVLKVNPRQPHALLAMARLRQFDGAGDAADYVKKSLDVNPRSADAHAFSALLLIDLERYEDATAEATKGLSDDSAAYEPLVALSAARYLAGDTTGHRHALERAIALRPRSAEAEATLSDVMARNRLYGTAVEFAKRAVARDSKASRALSFLGVNALRVGDFAGGREYLERSFALDPYDPWAKNTLDLLDTYKDYDEVKSGHFTFVIEKKDAPLLTLYAAPLAAAAYDSLLARYGYRPPGAIRVEVYRSHADFSVRTVGLAGLGALGVSFGDVVAIDGPAARPPGEFNWGSTLWHELAHTFTLGASGNKVPRWFSEGLSVYEERRARPGWGDDVSPQFLAAFKGGLLVPLARMNDGFMRPRFPEQILFSYYQASLLAEMIEQQRGIAAIRQMLAAYRAGATTPAVVRSVLQTDMDALQQQFDGYIRQRFATQLDAVDAGKIAADAPGVQWGGPFADDMRAAFALAEAKQVDQAIRQLEAAKRLFPTVAGDDSPYRLIAALALQRGDTARAVAELQAMTSINEDAYKANRELATLQAATGNKAAAAAALDRAMYIFPQESEAHQQLAELAQATGDQVTRIRERQALLALDPSDRVEALYQLALAFADAGQRENARRPLLEALELAPNFEKGQELLLRLRGRASSGATGNVHDASSGWRSAVRELDP